MPLPSLLLLSLTLFNDRYSWKVNAVRVSATEDAEDRLLADLIVSKGRRFVSVAVPVEGDKRTPAVKEFARRLQHQTQAFVRLSTWQDDLHEHDFKVFLLPEEPLNVTSLGQIIEVVASTDSQSSAIMALTLTQESESALTVVMTDLQQNAFFYLVADNRVRHFIAFSNAEGFAHNQVTFSRANDDPTTRENENRTILHETFDLGGLQLVSSALDWAPYLMLDNCSDHGLDCISSGFLKDLTDQIGAMFNFTYRSVRDPDMDWGVTPVSGPYNSSGEWDGSMGDVINGRVQFSLSMWVWNIERRPLLDFAPVAANFHYCALTPQQPSVDTGLFIRPFTSASWRAIIGMTVLILATVLAPFFLLSYFEETLSYRVVTLSSWYFFVLLNAYYGGALTMFFTSDISIPFESLRQVMRAYPDWKLMYMRGSESKLLIVSISPFSFFPRGRRPVSVSSPPGRPGLCTVLGARV